ncbi:AarF/ABC1/UbiB kinase family protein [Candidatus Nomurabacteria bacterium]|nr:AarF/ABC1/UbiB kinase family protein [Candidatus Nomurabacteria bacterium]
MARQKQSIAAIKRYRAARMGKILTRAFYLHRRGKKDELTDFMANEMVALGGVYVKFMQGVLLQSEFMKRWRSPDKLKIFERLESEPLNIVEILNTEIPAKYLKDIVEIQPQPFAAGSFGQVYYGKHANGKPIIVKVLRPMIRETLKFDLKLLSGFSKALSKRMYQNASLDMGQAFKDFTEATLHETDYVAEKEFAIEQYQHYKDHPKLVIPETYPELCSENIITQEYIGGISAAYLVGLVQQGVDPIKYVEEQLGSDLELQLKTLAYELILGVFTMPRIQGDPHPGNVKLLPENKVALIDFGISARSTDSKGAYFGLLKEYDKLNKGKFDMISLFTNTLRFFGGDLYRALLKLGNTFASNVDMNKELSRVVSTNFKILSGGMDIKETIKNPKAITILNRIANKDNKFGFVVKIESTEMLRAAQSVVTLLDSLGMYQKVVPEVYDAIIKKVEAEMPEIATEQDPSISTDRAIDIVSNWLERVADRDPALFKNLMEKMHMKQSVKAVKNHPTSVKSEENDEKQSTE